MSGIKMGKVMCRPGITIEDVNLQLDNNSGYIEGKVQITIALKNNSKTEIYYVLKRPRNIDYDHGSRTLLIGLYEKEPPQDEKVGSMPFEPEQVAIMPDTEFQWKYLVPLWIKRITRPSGAREIVEVLNISDVQKVVCKVAYHTSPFRVELSDKMPVALSKWGEVVSAGFGRAIINH